jgi:hypothetical protein
MKGGLGWDDAFTKAQAFVSQLTLAEKVNLTSGVGWEGDSCVGNTGGVPRLGFAGFCMQDSPLGVRDSKHSLKRRGALNSENNINDLLQPISFLHSQLE